MEGYLLIGGGSYDHPDDSVAYVNSFGHLCAPDVGREQQLRQRPPALWGAGAAGVDDGVVLCGGRDGKGKVNRKVL